MKTLHITTGLDDGGAEAILFRLITHCSDYHHTVVSLMDEGKYGEMLREAGVEVCCLEMPAGRIKVAGLLQLFLLIRSVNPDVIQTWMYHADLIGGTLGRLAGVYNVNWGVHHTTLEVDKSKKSTIRVAKVCALTSRLIPKNIVCCAYSAFWVHERLGYRKDKLRVVNNGHDMSAFYPDPRQGLAVRAELGISDTIPLIGMVARVEVQKDHLNLLKSLRVVRDQGYIFKCCLVGRGAVTENKSLWRGIKNRGLQDEVILVGQRPDISWIMNALDIHVLSSSFGEAFPNVLCEAMASGTPCVTTDVGDSSFIIGETGWLVPPMDPQALANSIVEAFIEMNDKYRWEKRRAASRQRIADHFNIDKMVNGFVDVWSSG